MDVNKAQLLEFTFVLNDFQSGVIMDPIFGFHSDAWKKDYYIIVKNPLNTNYLVYEDVLRNQYKFITFTKSLDFAKKVINDLLQ